MSIEFIGQIQAYAYLVLIAGLCIGLYAYFFHLLKSEKTGRKDYEKYGNLALNDGLDDEIVESVPSKDKEEKGA
ncbi:MAG: cytochrome c oxidase, cbb3-type, CcoQ subunit [Campylobacter sp.]|nr:cytochrome c oxidase, cbb3-type, CcoQ subunit [Campylobacter sp.]